MTRVETAMPLFLETRIIIHSCHTMESPVAWRQNYLVGANTILSACPAQLLTPTFTKKSIYNLKIKSGHDTLPRTL